MRGLGILKGMARRTARMTLRQLGITAFLAVLIVWLSFLVAGIYRKERIAQQAVADTRAELAALSARQASLSGTVDDLETERGQEASLRETYGVAKPGEDVIVVVPDKDLPPPPQPTFWDKVKDFFGL